MRVLVACEESQAVCKEFRALGHEAYSCDIQECSGGHPEWHFQQDVFEVIDMGWDMMIAHPPCTFISKAGARWMYLKSGVVNNERLKKAMDAKDFFFKLLNAKIEKIAIENPQPLKIVGLPNPQTYVQPFEYGHPYSKKTYLWLKNLPPLLPTCIMANYKPFLPSNTGGKKRGQKATPKSITQKDSSKTFPGIAKAMAQQWGSINI